MENIEQLSGKRTAYILEMFSGSANKELVYLNEKDREIWLNFLISAHLNNSKLSVEDLFGWLIENGWHGKTAWRLSSKYKQARILLKKYSEQK